MDRIPNVLACRPGLMFTRSHVPLGPAYRPPDWEEHLERLRERARLRLPLFADGPPAADPRHNWRPWTPADDEAVRGLSVAAAARRLGRTTYSVERRRQAINRQLRRWGRVLYGVGTTCNVRRYLAS
jgi:hypothetical protein